MSRISRILLAGALALAAGRSAVAEPPPAPEAAARRAVHATLALAIERGVPLFNAGQAKACADLYEVAARAVLALGGTALAPHERAPLAQALARLPRIEGARERAWLLRRALDQVLTDLAPREADPEAKPEMKNKSTFEPLLEAPLPAGFPAPGPVGEVVVKDYPSYRAARAEGGNSFWTLFTHIKKHRIAMTAPVEMGLAEPPDGGEMQRQNMAFLYASPDLGKPGRDGRVEVVDLKPVRVLSCGIRGPLTREKVEQAKRSIAQRLEGGGERRAGAWRLLGYNSPMVPATRRFWELQLPVVATP
ncbi:MAG: heme-binding protein [Planctomycetota bacterium]|jgi:hypothetical protein